VNIEKMAIDDEVKLLHIYGQDAWHDSVHIAGNREALEELRETIDEALCGVPYSMEAMVNDGEFYDVRVVLLEGDWDAEYWQRLAVPYSADCAAEKREQAIMPWMLK